MVLLSALLGACSVGEVSLNDGGTDTGGGTPNRTVCEPRVGAPPPAHIHAAAPADARSGLACIAGGCHLASNLGAGAGAFAFAGTVYKATDGAAVAPGVTIRMFPRGGQTSLASAVTDAAGNFVIRGNFTAFPYETHVTACGTTPDIRPMSGLIATQNEANCSNGGTCHGVPGGAAAVYMPD